MEPVNVSREPNPKALNLARIGGAKHKMSVEVLFVVKLYVRNLHYN